MINRPLKQEINELKKINDTLLFNESLQAHNKEEKERLQDAYEKAENNRLELTNEYFYLMIAYLMKYGSGYWD